MKVAICEYGAGNVRSVEIAFRRLGAELIDSVRDADLAYCAEHGLTSFGVQDRAVSSKTS